jgi:superfamily II DNA/RNA helicase
MSFTVFNFHPNIITAIQKCGYTVPTPIQQQAIPPVLEGRDLLGLAQTGTGKTAAFVLPTLQRLLDGPRKSIRALIVAPTRELAEQIHSYIEKMAHMTNLRSAVIYGGVSKKTQAAKIRAGVEIVVACPGRLLDHMNDRVIDLSRVEILILDEADHMFDKGFLPDIRRILKSVPKKRQSLVFSATMPKEIRHLAEDILENPATVQINHTQAAASITHALIPVEQKRKTELLKNIIELKGMTTTLVFTKTKYKAKNVAQQLENSGYRATSIQGNLSQNKRQQALDGFKSGVFNILVATDIAARGIDVSGISHVINYDVPDTAEAYTHRTGRTGRAACTGEAFTFMTAGDDKMIKLIEQTLGKKIVRETVAGFNINVQDKIDDEAAKKAMPTRSWNKKKSPSTAVSPKQNQHKQGKTGIFGVTRFQNGK